MPTGPADSTYIIPQLTLSDTMYEWYTLTNTEIIDKLNRIKVYQLQGATGIGIDQQTDGTAVVFLEEIIPGDHTFTGNITFDGMVTTVNSNLVTIDDYNLVLGAVGSSGTGGTSDTIISNAGGGGIIIAGACGDKYFLWKAFDDGKTFPAWRISDPIAFTGAAKFYSKDNKYVFGGDGSASATTLTSTHAGSTIDVESNFAGTTYGNISIGSDGSTRLINGSLVRRFSVPAGGITGIGLTFGMVVRHDPTTGGITKAQANTVFNAESMGIAVNLNTTQSFVDVNMLGYVSGNFADAIASSDGASSLGTGEFYFLSESEAGKITKNAPTTTGFVRKPVLYALGATQAMVMNYVGNKIVDIDSLFSRLNASTVVVKHDPNFFAVGDAVRFEEGLTASDRPFGSYVKASASTSEFAEALGIISKTNYGGNSAASLMTISGYIDLTAAPYAPLTPGSVYFLGTEEGTLVTAPPSTVNTVRKPMLVAVTPTSGIVQNYVGLVMTSNVGSGSSIEIPEFDSGFKNKLINGNFDFWQRGTTFPFRNPITEPNRFTADRWKMVNAGGTTADRLNVSVNRYPLSLGEISASNVYSQHALEFAIGTGGYTSGSETYLYQRVEGIENLPSGYATISFYAKATVANAKLGVSFRRDFGGGTAPDYFVTGIEPNSQKEQGFVVSLPTQWAKFTYTIPLPDSKFGLVGASGTDGPEIRFFLRGGSDRVGTDVAEEINPNIANAPSYSIYLAQVQLEQGQAASPFELNDPQTDYERCLRYYQTTNAATPFRNIVNGDANASNNDSIPVDGGTIVVRYPVEIRDASTSQVTIKGLPSWSGIITKSSKGFKATKSAGSMEVNYEVESEL
jgi:hypothetical protein